MPRTTSIASAFALTIPLAVTAQDFRPPEGPDTEIKQSYSPFAGQDFPQNAFHTPAFVLVDRRRHGRRDPIQMIKGWVDADGETQERIWDIACADDRAIVDGRCEAMSSTR